MSSNKVTFVAGGAATNDPSMRNALDETVQPIYSEGRGRSLRKAVLNNPGNATAFVKLLWSTRRWDLTFGGVIVDGDYILHVDHPSLAQTVDVPVERDSGTPADEPALAVAMETAIEGESALDDLIASADDDATDGNLIVGQRNVHDLVLTATAPGTATMEIADVLPVLTADLPDILIPVPAGETVRFDLQGVFVRRLWMAATAESGLGATAPNADVVGTLFLA